MTCSELNWKAIEAIRLNQLNPIILDSEYWLNIGSEMVAHALELHRSRLIIDYRDIFPELTRKDLNMN